MPLRESKDKMNSQLNETGNRYGRLIVLKRAENDRHGNNRWLCRCDCGTLRIVVGYNLRNGNTRSCGCLRREAGTNSRTHGMTGTRIYKSWDMMIQRCTNPRCKDYYNYGGRGIQVCPRWRYSFENFLKDMGDMPEGLILDRINNDGHYELGNCRWATPKEQANNRRKRKFTRVEIKSNLKRITG